MKNTNEQGGIFIPNYFFKKFKGLSATHMMVLAMIKHYTENGKPYCYLTVKDLSDTLQISERWVKMIKADLKELGYIMVNGRRTYYIAESEVSENQEEQTAIRKSYSKVSEVKEEQEEQTAIRKSYNDMMSIDENELVIRNDMIDHMFIDVEDDAKSDLNSIIDGSLDGSLDVVIEDVPEVKVEEEVEPVEKEDRKLEHSNNIGNFIDLINEVNKRGYGITPDHIKHMKENPRFCEFIKFVNSKEKINDSDISAMNIFYSSLIRRQPISKKIESKGKDYNCVF